MENGYDHETGEVTPTIGQRAQMALRERKLVHDFGVPQGFGGDYIRFMEAFARAEANFPAWIQNDAKGAHGASYATLKKINVELREPLRSAQIVLSHSADYLIRIETGTGKGYILPVFATLIHWPSGGWRQSRIDMPVVQFNPQAVGSAYSYGKRYATLAACGLATDDEDDDGEKGMGNKVDGDSIIVAKCKEEIDKCKSNAELDAWSRRNAPLLRSMDPADHDAVVKYGKEKREACQA